ncbi:MAG: uroporphyrinogen-III synthase [Acidobacteriaceae bacterium]
MKPLDRKRILVTRARHQAQALASALEAQGAEVLSIPAIEIAPPDSYAPLDAALRDARKYQWLVLTSVNAVDVLVDRLEKIARATLLSPVDAPDSTGFGSGEFLRIAAMGPATARALEARGLTVDVVPQKYIAESLVEALRDQVFGQNVLLVRAKVARDVVPVELERAGARIDVVDAYQTVVPARSCEVLQQVFDRPAEFPHAVTFTSSSTVTNFFRLLDEAGISAWPPSMAAASIGPITSRTLLDHGIEPVVEAAEYTIPGLVAALCRWAVAEKNHMD